MRSMGVRCFIWVRGFRLKSYRVSEFQGFTVSMFQGFRVSEFQSLAAPSLPEFTPLGGGTVQGFRVQADFAESNILCAMMKNRLDSAIEGFPLGNNPISSG